MRVWRTGLRTLHLLSVAALYGGHLYGVERERLIPALLATLASGGLFAALEILRAPIWLVQVRVLATYVKLALLCAVGLFWNGRLLWLTLALVIGAVVSHMPGRWRYHSFLHGRPYGPQEKG